MFVRLCICMYVCAFVCLFVCVFVRLCIYTFVYLRKSLFLPSVIYVDGDGTAVAAGASWGACAAGGWGGDSVAVVVEDGGEIGVLAGREERQC